MDFPLHCKKCGYIIDEPKNSDYRFIDGQQRFPYCPKCIDEIMTHKVLGISSAGDPKEFWSLELGMLGEQQREYKKLHPDVEFNKYGARKVRGYQGVKKVLKERGMVELSDSKECREHIKEERDKALETGNDEKVN